MIDRQHFLDQPVENDMRTYNTIRKVATGCLLDYSYFKNFIR